MFPLDQTQQCLVGVLHVLVVFFRVKILVDEILEFFLRRAIVPKGGNFLHTYTFVKRNPLLLVLVLVLGGVLLGGLLLGGLLLLLLHGGR